MGTGKSKPAPNLGLIPPRNTPKVAASRNGTHSVLFSRRFREGNSFPNFVERSILELPLSKVCAVPFALQNRALFEGEKRVKSSREKGGKRGGQQRGQKGKKGRVKTGQHCLPNACGLHAPDLHLRSQIGQRRGQRRFQCSICKPSLSDKQSLPQTRSVR